MVWIIPARSVTPIAYFPSTINSGCGTLNSRPSEVQMTNGRKPSVSLERISPRMLMSAGSSRAAWSQLRPHTRLQGVNRALAHGQRGFLDGFAHCRVGVNRARKVLGAAAVFHVRDDFADEFAGVAAENLGAENFVGLRVGNDLHVAVDGVGGDGATIGGEV